MDQTPRARPSREWWQLLTALPGERGRVMVVGPRDSGKTALCQWLVERFAESGPTAWVDADVGQSQVGPPACVGWRIAGSDTERYCFVGDVTPASVPAATVAATVRMVTEAEASGARLVVIDTTGYLQGRAALAIKGAKLDLLAPLHLVALGDSPEVRRLLAAWRRDSRVTVHRLPVADAIRQKTPAERSTWRQAQFARYLQGSELHSLSLRGLALSGLPTASELRAAGLDWNALQGLLIGFHGPQRQTLNLGLVHHLDMHGQQLTVRATAAPTTATGIVFGAIRLQPDGSPRT